MKYSTIGAFKNVQNIPYCKADVDMRVGMGVILDRAAKSVKLPTTADECKQVQYIATNIQDKYQVCEHDKAGLIKAGEYVRADDLASVANMEIEFGDSEIKDEYTDLKAKDKLVYNTDGLLEKVSDVNGYKVYFEVIAFSAHKGGGIRARIGVAELDAKY